LIQWVNNQRIMAINRNSVITRYPEFEDIPAGEYFNAVIAQANLMVSATAWGPLYNEGLMALTAHYLELGRATRAGKAGAVSAERVGQLSTNYATGTMTDAYDSTSYGQIFKNMRNGLPRVRIL
jgi:hypothetical protein